MQPFPLLHDYPEWMYQGHILYSLFSDSNPALNQLFESVAVPVPNAISQVVIALLNYFVSPVMAGQVWLGVYFLLVILTACFAYTLQKLSSAMVWVFVATIAFGPGFWNGYVNFQFALLFFALFVVVGARRSLFWIFVFSILIYFSHASVFAGFFCYVALAERTGERRPSIVMALLPSIVCLAWYTVTRLLEDGGRNDGLGSFSQWVQYKIYTLAKQGPFHNFIQPDGESFLAQSHSIYIAGFISNFLVAMLIGIWILFIGWCLVRGKEMIRTIDRLAFSVTVLFLFSIWLLAGKSSFGVVNLGERFLIVALMILILHVGCPQWLEKIWVTICTVVCVGTLVCLLGVTRHADRSYDVDRVADSSDLKSYVEDIYKNSRHKYFNHRLFIYSGLGQFLAEPSAFDKPPLVDHQSSIVRLRESEVTQ